jgi:hypothetical protein
MKGMAKRMAMLALIATAVISALLIAKGHARWAGGLAVAAIWSVVNFSLIVRILETAILKEAKKNLPGVLMIKFPVLYLTGLWILNARIFPGASLLAGMGLTLASIGVATVWPRQS